MGSTILERYPTLERHKNKLTSAEEAVSVIQPGDHVFIGTAYATPLGLVQALERIDPPVPEVQLYHFLTTGAVAHEEGMPQTHYPHHSFFIGSDVRAAAALGIADYIPISLAQVPSLIENGRIPVDVALIQVSLPDEYGYVSLGVSVDITSAAVHRARKILAEINPLMPRTLGDTFVPMSRIDHFVPVETPVIEYLHPPANQSGRGPFPSSKSPIRNSGPGFWRKPRDSTTCLKINRSTAPPPTPWVRSGW